MARITIEADDAEDLRATVLALYGDLDGGAEGEVETDSPPVQARGGRRKKTSPAATAALATGGAPSAGDEPATAGSAAPASAASPDRPASSPGLPSNGEGAVTLENVKVAMTRAMEVASPLLAQKALEDAGLPKRLSEMSADQYPKVLETLTALIASV